MPPGKKSPGGAICVQSLDDSWNPAIHITYRTSLRSSSLREPRDPLLKVFFFFFFFFFSLFFCLKKKERKKEKRMWGVCNK